MEALIPYQDFKNYFNEDISLPDFETSEYIKAAIKAQIIIMNNMAQSHLFPLSRQQLDNLNYNYIDTVKNAIMEQTYLLYKINPQYLNKISDIGGDGFSLGSFSMPGSSAETLKQIIKYSNTLAPITKELLLNIGWLNPSLNCIISRERYYDK